MKAVIMAGGRGTRVAGIAPDIPKPMLPLCGKPVLQYQIENLTQSGISDITIVTGYLSNKISSYFDDGEKFNVHISYFNEAEPLGTAGALFGLYDTLPDSFLLLDGDVVFNIDFERLINFHNEKNALATLVCHPNSHPFDSSLIITDSEKRITGWINKDEARLYYHNLVNSGVHILAKELLDYIRPCLKNQKVDLDRDVLKPAIKTGRLYAYKTPEYIKDMGTPERLNEVTKDIHSGLVEKKNLGNKQRAVFLDRDGTINKLYGFITRPEDFELIDGVGEAIARINRAGYLAIVATNQPVIARGDCSWEELDLIHQKMETELAKYGAYLDAIYICPHHPDKGFPGERPEYKIDCNCRKPKPGMLLKAASDYNIDLSQSWMVGDDGRDIIAGKAAGCKTVLLDANPDTAKPDFYCNSLVQFVEKKINDLK
jgi:D,D-heptose 1,7-bisphosphate phosphatase